MRALWMQAVLVVDHDLFSSHFLLQALQTFFITEAVICFAFFNQLLSIFHVDTGFYTVTLYIRTNAAIFVRSLIMLKTSCFQCAVNDVHSTLYQTLLVSILNTKKEISSLMLCDQICV